MVKVELKTPKNKNVEFGDIVIEVKPFINIEEQVLLIDNYLVNYFNLDNLGTTLVAHSKYDYLKAEYNLIHSVFHLLTNVDIESLNTDLYDATDLWENVKQKIGNYEEFRYKLSRVVADVKEQVVIENSLGFILSGISEKALTVLDNFSKLTPDDIEKAKQAGLELLGKIENSPAQKMIEEGVTTTKRKSKAK
jgi:hypothetical protein